jgi:hypothetical protein
MPVVQRTMAVTSKDEVTAVAIKDIDNPIKATAMVAVVATRVTITIITMIIVNLLKDTVVIKEAEEVDTNPTTDGTTKMEEGTVVEEVEATAEEEVKFYSFLHKLHFSFMF